MSNLCFSVEVLKIENKEVKLKNYAVPLVASAGMVMVSNDNGLHINHFNLLILLVASIIFWPHEEFSRFNNLASC